MKAISTSRTCHKNASLTFSLLPQSLHPLNKYTQSIYLAEKAPFQEHVRFVQHQALAIRHQSPAFPFGVFGHKSGCGNLIPGKSSRCNDREQADLRICKYCITGLIALAVVSIVPRYQERNGRCAQSARHASCKAKASRAQRTAPLLAVGQCRW